MNYLFQRKVPQLFVRYNHPNTLFTATFSYEEALGL